MRAVDAICSVARAVIDAAAPELGAGHDPLLCDPPVSPPKTAKLHEPRRRWRQLRHRWRSWWKRSRRRRRRRRCSGARRTDVRDRWAGVRAPRRLQRAGWWR
jgi:hypothetical protein